MLNIDRANFELNIASRLVQFVPHLATGTHYNAEHGLYYRAGAIMENAKRGLPLDELLIGFQARIDEVGGFNGAFYTAMNTLQRPA
jgi:hypothetical protein